MGTCRRGGCAVVGADRAPAAGRPERPRPRTHRLPQHRRARTHRPPPPGARGRRGGSDQRRRYVTGRGWPCPRTQHRGGGGAPQRRFSRLRPRDAGRVARSGRSPRAARLRTSTREPGLARRAVRHDQDASRRGGLHFDLLNRCQCLTFGAGAPDSARTARAGLAPLVQAVVAALIGLKVVGRLWRA